MRLCGSLACRREEKWRSWSRGCRRPPGPPSPFAQTLISRRFNHASAPPGRSAPFRLEFPASRRLPPPPPHHHSRPLQIPSVWPFRPVEFRDFLGRGRGGSVSDSHFQGTPRQALVTVSRSNSVCVPLHLVGTGQKRARGGSLPRDSRARM